MDSIKPKAEEMDAATSMLMLNPEAQQPSTSGQPLWRHRSTKHKKYESHEARREAKKRQNREASARNRAKRATERDRINKTIKELELKNQELLRQGAELERKVQQARQRIFNLRKN